ncbi:ArsR family transcriptional regulator [Halorubrum halophilum]|uniref:DUF7342 family protein n=1 Tax=Halorubrum halophilum TaxID=413816 RepID=UPI00186B17C4|nr:ArsR family transcriptional regulator [Halorubrum halophilum]
MSETWVENTTAFDRIRGVAGSLTDPQSVAWIAEEAHVAENTARNHLDRLADLGVLTTISTESGVAYYPDPIYTRSQDLRDLVQNHSERELASQAADLQGSLNELKTRYDVGSPSEIRATIATSGTAPEEARERLEDASEWEHCRYRLSLIRDALEHYDTYDTSSRSATA